MERTNQQIQEEIEATLAGMSEEERAATLAADDAMDRLMCIKMSRELQATIETIPGDRHHIKVNGEVMGYNEYAQYVKARYAELHPEEEEEEEGSSTDKGFFDA